MWMACSPGGRSFRFRRRVTPCPPFVFTKVTVPTLWPWPFFISTSLLLGALAAFCGAAIAITAEATKSSAIMAAITVGFFFILLLSWEQPLSVPEKLGWPCCAPQKYFRFLFAYGPPRCIMPAL